MKRDTHGKIHMEMYTYGKVPNMEKKQGNISYMKIYPMERYHIKKGAIHGNAPHMESYYTWKCNTHGKLLYMEMHYTCKCRYGKVPHMQRCQIYAKAPYMYRNVPHMERYHIWKDTTYMQRYNIYGKVPHIWKYIRHGKIAHMSKYHISKDTVLKIPHMERHHT